MSTCKACKLELDLSKFEMMGNGKPRGECKACRNKKRAESKKAAPKVEPDIDSKPTECVTCKRVSPHVDFKWRTDIISGGWRNVCNTCYGERKYDTAYRERERAKDEEGYLARNNAIQRDWQLRNPHAIKNQAIKDASVASNKIRKIKATANYKEIDFADDDMESMSEKLDKACAYCAYLPAAGSYLNGLDRVDTNKGYTDDNTVSCCASCNAMKCSFQVEVFIHKAKRIYDYRGLVFLELPEARARPVPFGGTAERCAANPNPKTISLTHGEMLDLQCSPCYLCNQSPSFGIDRVDSNEPYIMGNVMPCCTECNYMKKDTKLSDFEQQIAYIAKATKDLATRDVTTFPTTKLDGSDRIPVKVLSSDGYRLIFPSEACAVRILRRSALDFRSATFAEYRSQHKSFDEVKAFVESI
jgi:hypothetical protein